MFEKSKIYLLYVLFFSLVIKFGLLLTLGIEAFPDSIWYLQAAEETYKNGLLFPNSLNSDAPGTPYFYALFYPLKYYFGSNIFAYANILIASLSLIIFYKITEIIFRDKTIALISAFICCIYPFFNFYTLTILSETIYIFFLYLSFFFLIKFFQAETKYAFLLFCFFFAIDTLIRFSNLAMFPFFILLTIYILKRKNSLYKYTSTLLTGFLIFLLVMSVWWIRNYHVHGEFIATSVGESGKVFYTGNNKNNLSGGGIGGIDVSYDDLERFNKIKDIKRRNEIMINEGLDWIKDNPLDYLVLEIKKLIRFYSPIFFAEKYDKFEYNIISLMTYGVIFILFVFSLYIHRNLFTRYSPMFLYLILLTGIHLVFVSSIRYRLPTEPFMIIMASPLIKKFLEDYFQKLNFA